VSAEEPTITLEGDYDPEDEQLLGDLQRVVAAFEHLVQVVIDTNRDGKLIAALLHTMVEFVQERGADVLVPNEQSPDDTPAPAQRTASSRIKRRGRLRPEYRLRIEAIIDSWSDDETADFLQIGARHVRRRAQQGTLYFFLVGRRRRFPIWQFENYNRVLPGAALVGRGLPPEWAPERVYVFMTALNRDLGSRAPIQWLLMNRPPETIIAISAMFTATPLDPYAP
jgi:hypothetical protein